MTKGADGSPKNWAKVLTWTLEPVLLFCTVFIVSHIWQKFALSNQESLGLFLWAPDYLNDMLSLDRPLSRLIGAYLVQFFRFQYLAEAITASIVCIIFLLIRWITSRCGFTCGAFCTLVAAAVWTAMAKTTETSLGILILLIAAALSIACIFIRLKEFFRLRFALSAGISIILLICSSLLIARDKEIQSRERWSLIEQASVNHNWDAVLSVATPSQCRQDRETLPFALLALNEKGQLAEKMFLYPIQGPEDLDTEGSSSRRAFLFSSVLYESLGCSNEAIHQTFQSACFTAHGTSFGTLRQLVRFYAYRGDEAMVRKYCTILQRSSLHKAFTEKYLALIEETKQEKAPENDSWQRNIMNHDQLSDLILLQQEGISSGITMDRYFCYLLAKKDINSFKTQFELAKNYYQTIPRHFREALEISEGHPSPDNIYYMYCQAEKGIK